MSSHGHRWLGRWKLQVCGNCGARSRGPGNRTSAPRQFSVGTGPWTTQVPECRVAPPREGEVGSRTETCLAHLEPEPCQTCAAYIAAGL
jgi:hypothetical protein